MKIKLRFHRTCFILTIILLAIEIYIALFVHDHIIRPYVGDFLVVILVYCFLQSFFNLSVDRTAAIVFVLACSVETLQYFDLVGRLGLRESTLANIILGNGFSWLDIVAYTLGILTIIIADHFLQKRYRRFSMNNIEKRKEK